MLAATRTAVACAGVRATHKGTHRLVSEDAAAHTPENQRKSLLTNDEALALLKLRLLIRCMGMVALAKHVQRAGTVWQIT